MFTYDELVKAGTELAEARRQHALLRLDADLYEAHLVQRGIEEGRSVSAAQQAARAGDDYLNNLRRDVVEAAFRRDLADVRYRSMLAAMRAGAVEPVPAPEDDVA